MKKIIILFLGISLFCLTDIFAQNVTNIQPVVSGNDIIIKYNISGAKFNQTFDVSVYYSTDGGENFNGPLLYVEGDVGKGINGGENKIKWHVFKEVNSLDGDVVFNVKAVVIEEKIEKQFFVSYSGSLHAPLGFMVGMIGKVSWYGALRTGFTIIRSADYEYGGSDWNPGFTQAQYYVFNDNETTHRLSATGGLTWQAGRNLFVYAGGGLGIKELWWQMDVYDYSDDSFVDDYYVKHPDYSFTGFELEGGLIYRINSFVINAGVSTASFRFTDVTAGFGYVF